MVDSSCYALGLHFANQNYSNIRYAKPIGRMKNEEMHELNSIIILEIHKYPAGSL